MKRILLVGRTGVGKSSFVNATFGVQLAPVSAYEPCTRVIEHYSRGTPFGDVCLIDTPGLAEDNVTCDETYLELIRRKVDLPNVDRVLYLSRLDETRLRPDETRSLKLLTQHLGLTLWERSGLVLTFAASVPELRRTEATARRIHQIEAFLGKIVPRFHAFQSRFLVDNVVGGWSSSCRPIAALL